jgi:thioesterase domain-containing protein/acyl carrier protein
MPLTPSGKVDRQALPAPQPEVASTLPPRDEVELRLARIWQDLLEVESVGVKADFFALGGHSLRAVQLQALIEEEFGISLPVAVLFSTPTIEGLAQALQGERRLERMPVVTLQAAGPGAPLFCVHPVGGNILCYADLVAALGPRQPVYGLQLPAPEFASSLQELASRYVRVARELHPEEPIRLLGWSLGGWVALEMARCLLAEGAELGEVLLIDPTPPDPDGSFHRGIPRSPLRAFVADLMGGEELGLLTETEDLPEEELLVRLIAEAKAGQTLAPGLDITRLQEMFGLFRANLSLLESYLLEPFPAAVTVALAETRSAEESHGWPEILAKHFPAGARRVVLPGDHYSLLRRPQVESLMDLLG